MVSNTDRSPSDALVFFGGAGRPRLRADLPGAAGARPSRPPRAARRGRREVRAVDARGASSWSARKASIDGARPLRRAGLRQAGAAASLRGRRLLADGQTFARLRTELGDARRPLHYLAIPPSLFATVIQRAPARRSDARRARRPREAVRTRPRVGTRRWTAIIVHSAFPEELRLPHRPLPRQGGGADHALFPLCQRLPRADLEPPLHRERADHVGRDLRRARPRQALRRSSASMRRRRAEPHAPDRELPGHGAAPGGTRDEAIRDEQGACAAQRAPGRLRGHRARPVSRLPRGGRRRARVAHVATYARHAQCTCRLVALGGRAVLHPRGQAASRPRSPR